MYIVKFNGYEPFGFSAIAIQTVASMQEIYNADIEEGEKLQEKLNKEISSILNSDPDNMIALNMSGNGWVLLTSAKDTSSLILKDTLLKEYFKLQGINYSDCEVIPMSVI